MTLTTLTGNKVIHIIDGEKLSPGATRYWLYLARKFLLRDVSHDPQ